MAAEPTAGVEAFLGGLRRCGIEAHVQDAVVTFPVEPHDGARRGTAVPTGVAVAELAGWPVVPPHWVHLPADVRFARTNMDLATTLPGWARHSRHITGWGDAAEPAQAWVAHLRAVLAEAVA